MTTWHDNMTWKHDMNDIEWHRMAMALPRSFVVSVLPVPGTWQHDMTWHDRNGIEWPWLCIELEWMHHGSTESQLKTHQELNCLLNRLLWKSKLILCQPNDGCLKQSPRNERNQWFAETTTTTKTLKCLTTTTTLKCRDDNKSFKAVVYRDNHNDNLEML